jgi:ribulose-5-phosphate 4-epimerase/fuculose-1-phosphate aldolase
MLSFTSSQEQSGSPKGDMSPEEWKVRVELAAAYRLAAHFGWDDVIFTHMSARVPGPEHHFLINPLGLMFNEITASNLVKIDLQGNKVDGSPYPINAAGFVIHGAVHSGRQDAGCVVHLHTIAGTAIACQEDGLLPVHQTAMLLNGQVAYHDYEGVAFNADEGPRLIKDLGHKAVLILRNHGTLTVGPSVAAAFATMYVLERACQMQVAALSGGVKLRMPSLEIQQLVEQQAKHESGAVVQLLWATLVRMLDRTDPSYKQ